MKQAPIPYEQGLQIMQEIGGVKGLIKFYGDNSRKIKKAP